MNDRGDKSKTAVEAAIKAIKYIKPLFEGHPDWIYKENDLHWLLALAISERVSPDRWPWTSDSPPLVHREYPTRIIPGYSKGQGRHGTVDLVIIDEADMREGMSSVISREYEKMPCPLVVIEVGLNNEAEHVMKDFVKLADWVSQGDETVGVFCHFLREPRFSKESVLAKLREEAMKNQQVKMEEIPIKDDTVVMAKITRMRS